MRSIKHLNLEYIVNRLKVMWYEKRNPSLPWITKQMNEILNSWLTQNDIGIEWGSGRSTVWFATRISRLISIEHDIYWAETVSGLLDTNNLRKKVDYRVLPINRENEYIDAQTRYGELADNYVGIINEVPNNSLDFALIDGVERGRCAVASICKIKPGGIIIVDNVQWYLPNKIGSKSLCARSESQGAASEEWTLFLDSVHQWRCIWTTNGVFDTALWVKPSA